MLIIERNKKIAIPLGTCSKPRPVRRVTSLLGLKVWPKIVSENGGGGVPGTF